jgi:Plasmid encoded RepA protein
MNELKIVSRAEKTFLDGVIAMKQNPNDVDVVYLARFLIQCTLPHSNPGDVPFWKRKNGDWTLRIQPGLDENDQSLGYPYGALPRLVIIWMITQAKRTKSRRLNVGNSLTAFMRELGLDPSRGHKTSERVRLKDAMRRLFYARMSLFNHRKQDGIEGAGWTHMEVAPKGQLWWNPQDPEQNALWGSWIELGEEFFEAIMESTIPCDMRALRILKRRPLALDLYVLCNWIGANMGSKTKHWISWDMLAEQLGCNYKCNADMKKEVKAAMRKVKLAHPGLNVGYDNKRGGLVIYPSLPAVPRTIAAEN